MYKISGSNAANSGMLNATASGLGGAGQVASKWYNYRFPSGARTMASSGNWESPKLIID